MKLFWHDWLMDQQTTFETITENYLENHDKSYWYWIDIELIILSRNRIFMACKFSSKNKYVDNLPSIGIKLLNILLIGNLIFRTFEKFVHSIEAGK